MIIKKKRMGKNIILLLLSLVLVFGSFMPVFASEMDTKKKGSLGTSQEVQEDNGKDKEKNNFTKISISTEEELIQFAKKVNNGENYLSVIITLENDIVLTEEWTPIGDSIDHPFSGTFDGSKHSISGLKIKDDAKGGLFGYLYEATITDTTITTPTGGVHTGGLYYLATRSTIKNCFVQLGENKTKTALNSSAYSDESAWDGTIPTTPNPYPLPGAVLDDEYQIASAEEFVQFREVVNSGQNFGGSTVVLTTNINLNNHEWEYIGNLASTNYFSGDFNGQDYEIRNLKSTQGTGLFGTSRMGSIQKITISNFDITGNDDTGVLLQRAYSTNISSIVVRDGTIDLFSGGNFWGEASGIVYLFSIDSYSERGAVLQQCLVDSVTIKGSTASGITSSLENFAVNQNVVYNVSFGGSGKNSGIVNSISGPGGTYATASENLVIGSRFESSSDGIVSSVSGWNTASDNFITNVSVASGGSFYVGTSETPYGIQRFFTDSALTEPLITENYAYIINNFWDNISSRAEHTGNNNRGYSTAYLTSGFWSPSDAFWTSEEGFYPQISGLVESTSPTIQGISGLAAVALRPENILENYRDGVKELRVMSETTNGNLITWDYGNVPGLQVRTVTGEKYDILYTHQNASIPAFDLTASININGREYHKIFNDVVIKDSFLEEDYDKRVPLFKENNTAKTSVLLPTEQKFSRTFIDPIEENIDVIGTARLERKSGDSWILEQSIICEDGTEQFNINGKTVSLGFGLNPGTYYRMILPEGIVKEENKDNLSEAMEVYFHTAAIGAPHITILNPSVKGSSDIPFLESQITNSFKVEDTKGGLVIYDPVNVASASSLPKLYTGAWDDSDPNKSMMDALDTLPSEGIFYYIDKKANIVSDNPATGTHTIYVMVKNTDKQIATSTFFVTITGIVQWKGQEPLPGVHIPWTRDKSAIIKLAQQGATASTIDNSGEEVPCLVITEIDDAQWTNSVNMGQGPTQVVAHVYALDPQGEISETASVDVTVYLDNPLSYQMTPSPTTMNKATKRLVEKQMNVVAWNFTHDEIIYEHSTNDYRKPGTYYVDITSKPQGVTLCPDPKCIFPGQHPKDTLDDTFIVHIIDPPGKDITDQWGKNTNTLESHMYQEGKLSQTVYQIQPKSFRLPKFVPEALGKEDYSQMTMEYFGKYRWVFYSDSLDFTNKWSDSYDLQISADEPQEVMDLIGGRSQGISFRFHQSGKLFGAVEIEFNMEKAQLAHSKLPSENLGLYRYNKATKKLDLVSDVILVDDNQWASAVIDTLVPTTYVVKEKVEGDMIASDSVASKQVQEFYVNARQTGRYGEYVQPRDGDPRLVNDAMGTNDILEIIAGEKKETSFYSGITSNNSVKVGALVASLLGLGTVGIVLGKKRKEITEDEE